MATCQIKVTVEAELLKLIRISASHERLTLSAMARKFIWDGYELALEKEAARLASEQAITDALVAAQIEYDRTGIEPQLLRDRRKAGRA